MPQTFGRTRHGGPFWTRWRKKISSVTPSQSFAHVTPTRNNRSLSRGNCLCMLLKAAVSDLANIVCHADMYARRWYVISHLRYVFANQGVQCHTDQDNHRRMKCNQPCVRITCPRAHPCPLLCSDVCGDCMFPVYGVKLPCGHIASSVPWQVPSEFVLLGSI